MKINDIFVEDTSTSWSDDDGNIVTLQDVTRATKNIPITQIGTKELMPHLLHWDGSKTEHDRVSQVDFTYPILVLVDDQLQIKYILDGHHRVHKAIKSGMATVPGKRIKVSSLPAHIRSVIG